MPLRIYNTCRRKSWIVLFVSLWVGGMSFKGLDSLLWKPPIFVKFLGYLMSDLFSTFEDI